MTSIHIPLVAAAHRGEPVVSTDTGTPSAGLSSFPSEPWKLQNLYNIVTAALILHLIVISASTIILHHSHQNCGQLSKLKTIQNCHPHPVIPHFLHLLIIILFAAARGAQHKLPEHQLDAGDLS